MPEYGGEGPLPMPLEMTQEEMAASIAAFAETAIRAREAGFDGVEIHGANGYLIDQFLTDYTNRRQDEYGGDARGRVRFACDVLRAVRVRAGDDFPIGIRLSQTKVNDFTYRWTEPDARIIFAAMTAAGASYIHVASEGRDWLESAQIGHNAASITQLARRVSALPVIANGGLHDVAMAVRLIRQGHADLVSLGRAALANPDWPARLRLGQPFERFDMTLISPNATLEHADGWFRQHAASGLR